MAETHMAMIRGGVVENVAVVDPESADGQLWRDAVEADGFTLVDLGAPVGVGHSWDGTRFAAPAVVDVTDTAVNAEQVDNP